MNDKKPGRPTESVKDSILKIRVDTDTLETIDKIAKGSNQTRSEIVREILPIISSKDFEDMISLRSLQRLEQYSIQCIKYFSKPDIKIKVSDVSSNFPAFISTIDSPPILYTKYPTYKVRILQPRQYNAIKDKIELILKDINGISIVYEAHCVLFHGNSQNLEQVFLPELMCLMPTVNENTLLKDQVCSLLKAHNIQSEVWPAYFIIGKAVSIVTDNEESYMITP